MLFDKTKSGKRFERHEESHLVKLLVRNQALKTLDFTICVVHVVATSLCLI